MDEKEQVGMDGSPGRVVLTLGDLQKAGKFSHTNMGVQPLNLHDPVIDIKYQIGPLKEVGINGCSIEDVIDVLVNRLEGFQKGPFKCRENALAITKMEEAKLWLLYRTTKRQQQGVEGTNTAHTS